MARSGGEEGVRGQEGFVGFPLETVLFCQPGAECTFKSTLHHPCCAGGLQGWGGDISLAALSSSVSELPVMVAWSALAACDGPVGTSFFAFKETRGEPEVRACHSAPSELARNTLACPRGSRRAPGDG